MFENPPKKSADMVNTRGGSSIRPPPSKPPNTPKLTLFFSSFFFPQGIWTGVGGRGVHGGSYKLVGVALELCQRR